jgi:hypothetical protein
VNFCDFLIGNTLTHISRLLECIPCRQKLVKLDLGGFCIRCIASVHLPVVSVHRNEQLHFSIPLNNLYSLLSSHCCSSDCNATQGSALAGEELHFPSHDCDCQSDNRIFEFLFYMPLFIHCDELKCGRFETDTVYIFFYIIDPPKKLKKM